MKEITSKYLPWIIITALTILLALFYKFSPKSISQFFVENKNDFLSIYTENLASIFFEGKYNNEDIFNFAFSKNIKISDNKFLKIENNPNGDITFSYSNEKDTINYYKKYIESFELTSEEISELNKVLMKYENDLSTMAFVNKEKDVLAVDPKLADIKDALLFDIYQFSSKINSKRGYMPLPPLPPKPLKYQHYPNKNNNSNNSFLFFTPDSVFKLTLETNKQNILNELKKQRLYTKKKIDIRFNTDSLFSVNNFDISNNGISVNLPYFHEYLLDNEELDSLNLFLKNSGEFFNDIFLKQKISEDFVELADSLKNLRKLIPKVRIFEKENGVYIDISEEGLKIINDSINIDIKFPEIDGNNKPDFVK